MQATARRPTRRTASLRLDHEQNTPRS